MSNDYHLRYPIGEYNPPKPIPEELVRVWINDIARLPADLKSLAVKLGSDKLDQAYRPGGWTARQVIHHIVDSHVNSFVRFKLALTEENPTIRPYFEDRWAELSDNRTAPIDMSLQILEGLHQRWTFLLNSLTNADLKRTWHHPEVGKSLPLTYWIGLYAWHGKHHLEHVRLVVNA